MNATVFCNVLSPSLKRALSGGPASFYYTLFHKNNFIKIQAFDGNLIAVVMYVVVNGPPLCTALSWCKGSVRNNPCWLNGYLKKMEWVGQ